MPMKSTLVLFVSLFILSSCSMGPKILSHSPLEYNKSAQQTQNEQMLVNLVRTKYFEQPFFIQIGSISTSYSFGATAGANVQVPRERVPAVGIVGSATGTLQGTYQELPTFTFTPLQGKQYFEYLLKNIDLSQLVLLENWHFGFIMNTLIERMGRTYNDPSDFNKTYRDFLELSEVLSTIKQRKDMDFLHQPPQGGHFLRLRYQNREEAERVETLLGISKRVEVQEGRLPAGLYRLVPSNEAAVAEDDAGRPVVPIKLLSFLEILALLGQGVEVPPEHLEKGLVRGEVAEARNASIVSKFRVRQNPVKPENAFVTVAYRGRWFYLEDTDILSKEIFTFLNLIFSLQSQSIMGQQPSLTIPVR